MEVLKSGSLTNNVVWDEVLSNQVLSHSEDEDVVVDVRAYKER